MLLSGGKGVVVAANGKTPNRRLTALMVETGVSNKGLASRMREASVRSNGERIATTHTTIAKYLSGIISQPGQRSCDVLISVLTELTGRDLIPADVGYPQVSVSTPQGLSNSDEGFESPLVIAARLQQISSTDVDDGVLDIIDFALTDILLRYELEGPRRLAPEVFALRRRIEVLRKQTRHPLQLHRLYVLAAKLSGTLGYMAVNRGRFGHARIYCREAFGIASLIDDSGLQGWIRGTESFCAYYVGDFKQAADLARDGVRYAGNGPQSVRLYSNGLARALGKLGDADGVEEVIAVAMSLSTMHSPSEGLTPALTFDSYGAARLAANAATAFLSAGKFDRTLDYGQDVEKLVNESDSVWSRSLVRLDMATALIRSSRPDVEQAMQLGHEALMASDDRPIRSVWQRAHELGAVAKSVKVPEVKDYSDALREWSTRAKEFSALAAP